ncbi:hypothetical protein ACOSQ3_031053 [Xanthoceras sorbifolium]
MDLYALLTTIPKPVLPLTESTAASTFNLKKPSTGGFQLAAEDSTPLPADKADSPPAAAALPDLVPP